MGKALIQRQTNIEDAANVAFWINVALGVVIAGMLFLFSRPIAETFFQDIRVTAVLQVMTLQVIFGALTSVQTALLQKAMSFKKLFWVRFVTVGIPGIASIPLAVYGWGVWALVIGTLVGQFVQLIMLWRRSNWMPTFRGSKQVAKEVSIFGAWVSSTGLLNWFYAWGDTLVIGKFLGMHDLGLYRIGHQFSDLIYILIFSPLLPVAYSHFSRISNDLDHMRLLIGNSIILMIWISLPIGAFLFVFGENIQGAIFGREWIGLGLVIAYLSLRQSFAWLSSLNGEVYRALGKPHLEPIILLASLLAYVPTYIILAKIDLTAFIQGRLALVILSSAGHLWLLGVILKLPTRMIFFKVCLVMLLGLALASILHQLFLATSLPGLSKIVLAFVAYILMFLAAFVLLRQHQFANNLRKIPMIAIDRLENVN